MKKLLLLSLLTITTLQACEEPVYNETTGVVDSVNCYYENEFKLSDGRIYNINHQGSHRYCNIPQGTTVKFTYSDSLVIQKIDYVVETSK